MIEIGVVFWLTRRIVVIARAKRRDPTVWKLAGLGLWFGSELLVAAVSWPVFTALDLPLELAYFLALGVAILVVVLFVRKLERTPVQV